jgi:acetylornithine deacetylase
VAAFLAGDRWCVAERALEHASPQSTIDDFHMTSSAPREPLDPVALTTDWMAIDSTSGQEGMLIAHVHDTLEALGWRVTRIPVTRGRDDLLATDSASTAATGTVTLSTHLDTVPPFIAPRLSGDRLHGRGACDAKGIAAAMLCAGERLRARGVPVSLLFVVGEEVSHDGAHAANAWPTASRVLINGEPTESMLARGTKGALRVNLRTTGVAAHSAYPQLGHSATRALVRLLAEIDALPLPTDPILGDTTVNIGVISGGVADNVVAPWAEARLMLRTVVDPRDMVRFIRDWVGSRAAVEEGVMVPPVRLRTIDGMPTCTVAFATDIPVLTAWGEPYLFGPGSIHVAHRDDESIDVEELRSAVGTYERIAVEALARVT